MLDHEEKFLFKEEILALASSMAEPGTLDNALNFLNNPDGIQGHNFATQIAHVEERRVLQGRLTLVRYNNEPQFFVADAAVFIGLVTDIMERLGPYLEPDSVDEESLTRLREAVQ